MLKIILLSILLSAEFMNVQSNATKEPKHLVECLRGSDCSINHMAGYMTQKPANRGGSQFTRLMNSLNCLPAKQKLRIQACRPLFFSNPIVYTEGEYWENVSRGSQSSGIYVQPSSFSSDFSICALTKIGAYDANSKQIKLIELELALISYSSLSTAQKNQAVLTFCSCMSSASLTAFQPDEFSMTQNNQISSEARGLFCAFTALLQNGCSNVGGLGMAAPAFQNIQQIPQNAPQESSASGPQSASSETSESYEYYDY